MVRLRGVHADGADRLCPQEAYEAVVEYFGENPKTTSPSMFFSLFSRFVKAYKVCVSGGHRCRALQPLHVGSRRGGGCFCLGSRIGEGGFSSWRPTLAPQKAEQEVEQWKKEAAAQEAGADTPGRGEPPAPKVGKLPLSLALGCRDAWCSHPKDLALLYTPFFTDRPCPR